jgi:hypothetical protein
LFDGARLTSRSDEKGIIDEQQRKAMLKQTFDAVSGGYDGDALRFFPQSAQSMVSLLDLRGALSTTWTRSSRTWLQSSNPAAR